MGLKLLLRSRHNISPPDSERADEPEIKKIANEEVEFEVDQPEEKVDDLNPADDGEPSEEPHGASNEAKLGLHLDLLVFLNIVEGRRVKIDLHQLKN